MFTAALPPIPVTLDPRQLLAQSCDLSLLFLNAGIAGILFRPGTLPWHPTVMPDPLEKYKSKMLDLARHETTPLNKYLDYYSLGATQLAEKVKLTLPKSRAVVDHLRLREDADCFKEFRIGATTHARYSPKAIKRMQNALEAESIDDIWAVHRAKQKAAG